MLLLWSTLWDCCPRLRPLPYISLFHPFLVSLSLFLCYTFLSCRFENVAPMEYFMGLVPLIETFTLYFFVSSVSGLSFFVTHFSIAGMRMLLLWSTLCDWCPRLRPLPYISLFHPFLVSFSLFLCYTFLSCRYENVAPMEYFMGLLP